MKAHIKYQKKAGKEIISTSDTEVDAADPEDTTYIPPHLLAQVYVSGSRTVNLGNYEAAKITIGVTLPCHKEKISDSYEAASSWVSDRLEQAMKTVEGD